MSISKLIYVLRCSLIDFKYLCLIHYSLCRSYIFNLRIGSLGMFGNYTFAFNESHLWYVIFMSFNLLPSYGIESEWIACLIQAEVVCCSKSIKSITCLGFSGALWFLFSFGSSIKNMNFYCFSFLVLHFTSLDCNP